MKTGIGFLAVAVIAFILGRMSKVIPSKPCIPLKGRFRFMYVVKADETDKPVSVSPAQVTDSEGNPIPDAVVNVVLASSDVSVVEVLPDAGGDPSKGTLHFGNPGTALVTAEITSQANPEAKEILEASFNVTTGDPSKVSGGKITVEGLTEV